MSAASSSFAFTSMTYNVLSTSSFTTQSLDSGTTLDTLSATQSQSASHQGADPLDSYSGWNAGTFSQQDTVTSADTVTTSNAATYALYEAGTFGGQCWGLGSFNLSEQGLTTTSFSHACSVSGLQTGSYAGQRSADGVLVYNLSGTFVTTTTGGPHSQGTAVTGFSLVEQGGFANASFGLGCFAFAAQASSTASLSNAGSATQAFAGTDSVSGSAAAYSGVETSSSSSQQNSSASGSFSEWVNHNLVRNRSAGCRKETCWPRPNAGAGCQDGRARLGGPSGRGCPRGHGDELP
jgi:hypothetical protein